MGTTVSAQCKMGQKHSVNETVTSQCLGNGQWSPSIVNCSGEFSTSTARIETFINFNVFEIGLLEFSKSEVNVTLIVWKIRFL